MIISQCGPGGGKQHGGHRQPDKDGPLAELMGRTRAAALAAVTGGCTTSTLARRVGMSESKLKRAFKERFGTTVFEYGLECRMRHALELLRADSVSICQVAESVGYQHQTSFTAAFRDHFGFLPSEARARGGTRS